MSMTKRLRAAVTRFALILLISLPLVYTGKSARADNVTLDAAEWAGPDQVVLPDNVRRTIVVPVPAGYRLTRLSGTIEVPAASRGAVLEVGDSVRRLASIGLAERSGTDIPLDVDVSSAVVRDQAVDLYLQASSRETDCLVDQSAWTRVRDLQATFEGEAQPPTTVAEFLPPILRTLSIAVPADAGDDVRSAAVTLAGAIAARYRPASPLIGVVPLTGDASPADPGPFTRTIVLSGRGATEMRLAAQPNTLWIDGTGAALTAQVDALSGDLARIAVVDRTVAIRPQSTLTLPAPVQTLNELQLGPLSATGPGRADVALSIDAAALGTPVKELEVRLVGSVVTRSSGLGSGRGLLSLAAGGRTVESWVLEPNGIFDITAKIPGTSVGRQSDIVVSATADGTFDCTALPLVDLAIDGASTVTGAPAEKPYRNGFSDLPAALRPTYQIATDGRDLPGLNRAVGMAVALQRLTQPTLDPQLVDVQGMLASDSPAVLLTASSVPTEIDLPVRLNGTQAVLAGGGEIGAGDQLALFQVGNMGERTVVVLHGTDSRLLNDFAQWLVRPGGLDSLAGDVAVWSPQGTVETMHVRKPVAAAEPWWSQAPPWLLPALGIGMLTAVGVAVGILLGRRPRTDLPLDDPGPEP